MSDDKNPHISRHRSGQHPTLKSFRAFDIIPPSKVKPSHTSRPVITPGPSHADNTLTPKPVTKHSKKKLEAPKSASELPGDTTEVAASGATAVPEEASATDQILASAPTLDKKSLVDKPDAGTVSEPQLPSESTPIMPDAMTQDTTVEQPVQSGEASAQVPETTAALSVSKPADIPEAPAASEQPTDLNSVLAQNQQQAPIKHSEAFTAALHEFSMYKHEQPEHAKPFVAVHRHNYVRIALFWLMWLVVCVALAAAIIDVMLDAEILQTPYDIPHTNFINN